ncbi:MAG: hypothetical protein ACREED_09020 [Stellaceae bacterium]
MTRRTMLLLGVLALALMPASSWAAGMLRYAGRFYAGGSEFDVTQYSDGKAKIGVIGINRGRERTSVAFASDEWHSFAGLWDTARHTKSATWQTVGTFTETGADDAMLLSVAAGPGVQFTMTGKKGSFTFVLSPRDYAAFDATVRRMTVWFAH